MTKVRKSQTITVKTNEENPEPLEVIAKAIIDVAEAGKKIANSRLERRVIVLLIKDITGLSIREIELVLGATAKLEHHFIKKIPAKK